jgi:hypothetical protein
MDPPLNPPKYSGESEVEFDEGESDAAIYEAAIGACEVSGQWEAALALLRERRERGLSPPSHGRGFAEDRGMVSGPDDDDDDDADDDVDDVDDENDDVDNGDTRITRRVSGGGLGFDSGGDLREIAAAASEAWVARALQGPGAPLFAPPPVLPRWLPPWPPYWADPLLAGAQTPDRRSNRHGLPRGTLGLPLAHSAWLRQLRPFQRPPGQAAGVQGAVVAAAAAATSGVVSTAGPSSREAREELAAKHGVSPDHPLAGMVGALEKLPFGPGLSVTFELGDVDGHDHDDDDDDDDDDDGDDDDDDSR